MVLFNYATKEITMKVVYYGPGLCGKTTNLQYIHSQLTPETRGKLISLSTETDRTLFFDFLPMEMGTIKGFKIRFQLYTVPGQVRYNATRKLVLKGADGIVFVADSQRSQMDQDIESLENLQENLLLNGLDPDSIPLVFQFNKRDIKDINPVTELNEKLNYKGTPFFESIAIRGDGVLETFKEITKILLKEISQKHRVEVKEEILPSEPTIMEEAKLQQPITEDIHPAVEVERGITEEIASEVEEEAVSDAIEYLSPVNETVALEEIPEVTECPTGLEIPSAEEPPAIESETPVEELVEEMPSGYAPSFDEITSTLKGIKGSLDSLYESLSEFRKAKEQFTVHGSLFRSFLESLSELRNAQENLYSRVLENEETNRRITEEMLKSLTEIKGMMDSLAEKAEKKWFKVR